MAVVVCENHNALALANSGSKARQTYDQMTHPMWMARSYVKVQLATKAMDLTQLDEAAQAISTEMASILPQ